MIRIRNLVPYSCRHMWNCGNLKVILDIQEEKHFPRNNQLRASSLLQLKNSRLYTLTLNTYTPTLLCKHVISMQVQSEHERLILPSSDFSHCNVNLLRNNSL